MKNTQALLIVAVLVIAVVVLLLWPRATPETDPSIVSASGMHTHPELAVFVKGERMEVPENIGIGPMHAGMPGYDASMQMAAMHTHDASGVIHLEFMRGPVHQDDVRLGQFFSMWGKDMRSFGSNMRMTVNGAENTEHENYMMRDGDKIELHYE